MNKTDKILNKMNMKNLFKILLVLIVLGMPTSCTKDFADINTDPGLVTDPDLRHLFTYAIYNLGDYRYTEWFYDNYQYIWRYSQATIQMGGNSPDFNNVGALGGRYGTVYSNAMGGLFEIRYRIDDMEGEEKANRQGMYYTTYIPRVIQAIKATDWYGSMPFTESMQGRYDGNFTPVYDNQEALFAILDKELKDAADKLNEIKDDNAQVSFGNQDFIYGGNYGKWAMLANSLRLRIAVRLMGQNATTALNIISEVIAHPAGFITEAEDQMLWEPDTDYRGRAHDFWGSPSGSKSFMDFLRDNRDPRVKIMFDKNRLDVAAVTLLNSEDPARLPYFADPGLYASDAEYEEWGQFQGGPISPDSTSISDYFGEVADNTGATYNQLAHINRTFFNASYNGNSGHWMDVMFGAAEVCLYFAEFIEKGIVGNVDGMSAQEWYEKGVTTSIRGYEAMAAVHQIPGFAAVDDAVITAYLANPDVAYGSDNLEKIYIQQFVNNFRLPNEVGAFSRRTGYPKRGSAILPWEPVMSGGTELPLPRRFPVNQPSNETNIDNWAAAIFEQGFTHSDNTGAVLNSERIWWDKNYPNYGDGN